MPLVAPKPNLRDALAAYIAKTEATKAEAASKLGVDPMTLARFLKTGRAIEATVRKLEVGLERAGAWTPSERQGADDAHDHISSDKVISALEFLLAAAREARATK